MTFYGEEYGKPKLIESKIIKQIINTQNKDIPHEQKIFNYIYQIVIDNYKIILVVSIIVIGLYWRYTETKNKKKKNKIKNNILDYYFDSEII
jgi:heme/copper-type cytochrome/quinol oxidase subunit 2